MISIHLISLFPDVVRSYCNQSILGRALEERKFNIECYNPIDYTERNNRVDDKVYGGGPGMVVRPEPVLRAYDIAKGRKKNIETLFFECGGKSIDDAYAATLAKKRHIVLICGRYEGIDARVKKATNATSVCVGDATLTGGEVPAMYAIDAIIRTIPGVLGNDQSLETTRIASHTVYTRPKILKYKRKSYTVPKVLLSGNHQDVELWRGSH